MNSAQIDKKGKKKNHRGPSSASAHKAHSSHSNLIGDLLYMYGFWVEYIFVCAYRKAHAVVKGIFSTLARPVAGRAAPGPAGHHHLLRGSHQPVHPAGFRIRHIRELPQEFDAGSDQIRAAKRCISAAASANIIPCFGTPSPTCCVAAVAAAVLIVIVRNPRPERSFRILNPIQRSQPKNDSITEPPAMRV